MDRDKELGREAARTRINTSTRILAEEVAPLMARKADQDRKEEGKPAIVVRRLSKTKLKMINSLICGYSGI